MADSDDSGPTPPSGDATSGARPRSRGFVRAAVDDVSRLATVSRVLLRHGFHELGVRAGLRTPPPKDGTVGVDPRNDPSDAARRFRRMLEELGPTFVKVGQILSTRPDMLPPEFITELSRLQDAAPAVDFEEIRLQVETGLGRSIDAAFATFDEEPLASASMAQTHLATLHGGAEVVVKVQRPGIGETIRSDLDLLHLFARLLAATIEEMELYAPGDIVRALDDALSAELDFEHEATNLERFAAVFADEPWVHVPALVRTHTSPTVLTMERIRGKRIDRVEAGGPEAIDMAKRFVESYYLQIFRAGFFHADPHPGNLLVTDDGRLAFLDFGLCGRLSGHQREQLVALIIATIGGDIDGIARALLRMGRPLGPVALLEFKAEISSQRDKHLRANLREVDATAFMQDALDAAQRFRIRIAAEYSLLSKAAVTAEGVVRTIAPDFDLVEHVEPYGRRLLAEHYSPERILKGAVAGAVHLGHFVRDVPEQLGQVLLDVEGGRLQVNVKNPGLEHLGRHLNVQTSRLVMGIIGAAAFLTTPLWLAHEPWWIFNGKLPVFTTCSALVSATFTFWALAWHLIGGRKQWWRVRIQPLLRLLRGRFD